jgi:hypothetical protein
MPGARPVGEDPRLDAPGRDHEAVTNRSPELAPGARTGIREAGAVPKLRVLPVTEQVATEAGLPGPTSTATPPTDSSSQRRGTPARRS